MASGSIHQAIHGYRDGHRLLSSSTSLSPEASRTMLVLSDMSGPSMQTGFDEYLTAYPLPGAELFVLAKTWYAPEMQRPGCVWTHSLLLPRAEVPRLPTTSLLKVLRRPRIEGVESAASRPVELEHGGLTPSTLDGFADRAVAASLLGAVLGQPRPVIVLADSATQFEAAFLRLWEELWPAERTRFSFCTGALMPRANAGTLLDLQAVPRAVPAAQFRKSSSAALVLDVRAVGTPEDWVHVVLDAAMRGDAAFRTWVEAAAGPNAARGIAPSLAPIFGDWHAVGSSAQTALASVVGVKDLDPGVRGRLVGMVFERAKAETGVAGQRDLLQFLCRHREDHLASIAITLEEQTRRLFEESRAEGVSLVLSLLGSELTEVGERVLRAAVLLLVPDDVETLGDAHTPFLSTIVGANPALAQSPTLWKRVGSRAIDVLSQISTANPDDDARGAVVDAIFASGRDVSVDALVRFGGRVAIIRALRAIASGQLQFSWQWRSAVSAHPDTVLEWLEGLSPPSLRDLEIGSRFVSPKATQSRLAAIWKRATANVREIPSRVAAFGLTLALAESDVHSPLLAGCFQHTYDAAGSSRLDYEEWDWLRDYAPSVSWYRDWDRCERLAAAVARLFERQSASLETVFSIVHSRAAIRKVVGVLNDHRDTRRYLNSLRTAAESSSIGEREQRDALAEEW